MRHTPTLATCARMMVSVRVPHRSRSSGEKERRGGGKGKGKGRGEGRGDRDRSDRDRSNRDRSNRDRSRGRSRGVGAGERVEVMIRDDRRDRRPPLERKKKRRCMWPLWRRKRSRTWAGTHEKELEKPRRCSGRGDARVDRRRWCPRATTGRGGETSSINPWSDEDAREEGVKTWVHDPSWVHGPPPSPRRPWWQRSAGDVDGLISPSASAEVALTCARLHGHELRVL